MRDIHRLDGPKVRVATIEEAHERVVVHYPGSFREGSVGSWSWECNGVIVAEAWICRTTGWWLRIRIPRGR